MTPEADPPKESDRSQSKKNKAFRDEYMSGWLVLTRHETIAYMIDALLDLPPHREFNKTELAEFAGVSRQSVSKHLDFLIALEVVEEVEETQPPRYRFKPETDVSQAIMHLDGVMNAAGAELNAGSA